MQAINNEKYIKECFKFVSKGFARQVLTNVLLDADGSMIATDAHRLIIIKDAHTLNGRFLLDAEGKTLDGLNYPDVTRILPKDTKQATINVDEWLKAHKALNKQFTQWKQKERLVRFKATAEKNISLEIRQAHDNSGYIPHVESLTNTLSFDHSIGYNLNYMIQALTTLKRLGYKDAIFKTTDIQRQPFIIEAGNVITLIMPFILID